ncbi:T9SS type A sorting domain-containing protein [bacterium]|nr:T9SS type A sorting domain-containing protein [bacterium]
MEQVILSGAQANTLGHNTAVEIAGLEVEYTPGSLRTEIYIRDGSESLLSVYGITGQLKFRKKIMTSGTHEFDIDLKNGVYVATLISGKNWAARRIIVH